MEGWHAWRLPVVGHAMGHTAASTLKPTCLFSRLCSCNIPEGDPDTIDDCYKSAVCPQPGAVFENPPVGQLPSCTVDPSPLFNGGKGTIMSYCHQVHWNM